MDNLAHTLIGIGAARAGLAQRYGKGTTLTLAIASNLPDLDTLWAWWDGWDRFMLRRTHTHALVALPVLAAGLALVMRRFYPNLSRKALFGLAALGIGIHLFFDLVNSFGVVLFWPFSDARPELASIFIVDLFIWAVMLVPLLAPVALKTDAARLRAARGAVAALGVYVALCILARVRAETIIRGDLKGAEATVRIFPEPLGPQRFRAAVLTRDRWTVYACSVLSGHLAPVDEHPVDADAPRVVEIRRGSYGKRVDWFMAAPVWRLRPDGTVEVFDLRFQPIAVRRRNPFVVTFPPGEVKPQVNVPKDGVQ